MSNQSNTPPGEGAPLAVAGGSRSLDEREGAEQRECGRRMARNRASRFMRLSGRGMFFLICGTLIVLLIASAWVDGLSLRRGSNTLFVLLSLVVWVTYVIRRNRREGRIVASLAAELRGTSSFDRPADAFDWLERHWRSRLPTDMLIPLHTFDRRWIVQATWQGYPVLVFWMRILESSININKTIVFVSRRIDSARGDEECAAVEEEHFTLARFPAGVRGECSTLGGEALQWYRIRRVLDRSIAMIEGDHHA